MLKRYQYWWLVGLIQLCVAVGLPVQAQTALDPITLGAVEPLLLRLAERLGVAEDVARSKWNSRAPIEDVEREKQILAGLVQQAQTAGLDAQLAEKVFRAQIEASKQLQRLRHQQWQAQQQPAFASAPDLVKEVRPRLDKLTGQIIDTLGEAQPHLSKPEVQRWLEEQIGHLVGLEADTKEAQRTALQPLLQLGNVSPSL